MQGHGVVIVVAVNRDAQIVELEPVTLGGVAVSLIDFSDHA
jgi:hypothetical protein